MSNCHFILWHSVTAFTRLSIDNNFMSVLHSCMRVWHIGACTVNNLTLQARTQKLLYNCTSQVVEIFFLNFAACQPSVDLPQRLLPLCNYGGVCVHVAWCRMWCTSREPWIAKPALCQQPVLQYTAEQPSGTLPWSYWCLHSMNKGTGKGIGIAVAIV